MAEIIKDPRLQNKDKTQDIQINKDNSSSNNNNNNRRRSKEHEVDMDFWSSVITNKDTTMDETYKTQTENEQQQQQEQTDNTMTHSNMTQKTTYSVGN